MGGEGGESIWCKKTFKRGNWCTDWTSFIFFNCRRKCVCVSCMNQRHRSGKDKSREDRRQGGQKTASTQASRNHLISLSSLPPGGCHQGPCESFHSTQCDRLNRRSVCWQRQMKAGYHLAASGHPPWKNSHTNETTSTSSFAAKCW